MSQKTTLHNKGLYTDPNQLSGLPDGSMVVASNINIDRNDVVGSRRGFSQYGNTFGSPDDRAKQFLLYKDRLLVHYASTLLFNAVPHTNANNGDFEPFNGSFSELETGLRIRSVESNKNLYFTTSDGIKKISAKTAADFTTASGFIKDAGAIKALDVNGTLNSTTDGFLVANSEVAYRVVWSYKDRNNNLIVGTPSSRLVVRNATSNSANVNLEFVIPPGFDPSYFYQVYRSAVFTATGSLTLDDIDPGDELQLVIEDFPTPAQILANEVTVTDLAPEDFRQGGIFLYTNPSSGDGIGQSNEPPPKAHDVTMYQNTVFYANTETRARATLSLLGVEALVSGVSSITINDGIHTPQTYTFVGSKEHTKFDFTSYTGTIPSALNGKYFLLNSSSDKRKYYTWYDTTKTKQVIDFSLYIGVIPTDIDTKFFTLYSPNSDTKYYVWYDATGTSIDPGTNPANNLTGFAGIRVNVVGLTTNAQIANQTAISIGTNDINGDFDVNYSTDSAVGSTATAGNPTLITQAAHGLVTGDLINVTSSTTTPNINGSYYVTVTGVNTFTLPVTTTIGGVITWAGNSKAVIVYSNSFNTDAITEQQNILKGFSFTFDTPDNLDPALDPLTNTDIVGRIPFKVSISRNVTTKAGLADITAASISQQDSAGDFVVSYTTGNMFFEVDNSNNGKTTAASDSLIVANRISNGFAITVLQVGDGEDVALHHILLSDAPTPSQQIDETARSIVNVINNNSSDSVAAYYLSGPSDLPGQFLLEVKDIGNNQFTVTANNAATGASFNPPLPPATGASVVSGETEIKPNRIYFAKLQQPEAVPLLNFIDVGPEDKAISRILSLRESLFILKEDGVYRLTGTNGAYAVDLFDESTKIIAPDSAVVLNNQIYCLTNQGIVTISDTGVSIISRPIDTTVKLFTSSNYNFKHTTFGVSYETDRAYILWLPSAVTDTVATIAYRYNTVTQTFTTYDLAKTCGIVNLGGDDKLYLGPNDANFIERERKFFNRTDFADRDFELNIPSNSVNGIQLKLSSSVKVDIGDAALQTQYLTISEYNQLLKKLDLDPAIGQAEITNFDFSSYTGSIPLQLHSKYFILYSASDSTRYVVFYDAHGDLPSLDPTVFIDIADAKQIRVDISSGVTTKADLASATQTEIRSRTFDFIITYLAGNEFFQTKTIRNGNTTDASDSAVNGLHNGFAITVTQQGLGDYFNTLEALAGNNIFSKVNQLATKLDADPGVNQNDFVSAIGTYSATGVSITAGTPTIINSVGHNLQTGRMVTITNSTTTPSINGDYIITRIDANSFSIPVTTTGGSGGNVSLASSASFAILASSAITGSTGSGSIITGNIGIYPNTLSSITNFPPSTDIGTIHAADSIANQALIDATAAFTTINALSATSIPAILDGQTLTPGVYKEATGTFNLAQSGNGTLTFNGAGTYKFQCNSTLVTGAGGIPTFAFTGGATPLNTFIYWTTGSSATINVGVASAGSTFYGTVIAQASITATQAGNIKGRLFALVGSVTLSGTNIVDVPLNITTNYAANLTRFIEIQAAFNTIINKLNIDTSVTYQNYLLSEGTKEFEVLIIDKLMNTTDVTMQFSMPFIEGPITIYKSIICDVQYCPETFGDTSMVKQVTESTVIFEDTNFSRATVAFRTDLSPGYESINFTKSGKGDWGYFVWNQHNWGGGFSGVPLRTFVPRQKQRCRYIQLEMRHNSARERFVLYGFSYTYRPISERGYRA